MSEVEQIAIENFGLFNLEDFIGARPDASGIAIIKAMFEASVRGDPFDMDAFGAHYKPYGAFTNSAAPDGVDDFSSTPRETGASFARTTESQRPPSVEPSAEPSETGTGADMQHIISKLKERMPAAH